MAQILTVVPVMIVPKPATSYVQGGDTFTRDFIYDAAAAQGTVTVNGPLAARLSVNSKRPF